MFNFRCAILFSVLCSVFMIYNANANDVFSNDGVNDITSKAKPVVFISDDTIDLRMPGVLSYTFNKINNKWHICSQRLWNGKNDRWENTYSSVKGEFLYIGKNPVTDPSASDIYLFADDCRKINAKKITGVEFYGDTELNGVRFEWNTSFYFDESDNLPYLHSDISYKVHDNVVLGYSPKVITRTIDASADLKGNMAHIISYEQSNDPILIERGYPLIWMNTKIGNNVLNSLLINDVDQNSPEGRYFIYGKSIKSPFYSYWLAGSMAKDGSYFGKYYWNYRTPSTGRYPDDPILYAYKDYKIRLMQIYGTDYTNLEFYRKYWAKAFDKVAPMDKISFWSKDWDRYAAGQIEEFKDNDANSGDRYVPGKGYYSAPSNDKMSHGPGNVVWHGSVGIIHGMMYYTKSIGDMKNYEFYRNRLADMNLTEWGKNSAYNKGWINESWIASVGYPAWSSMWATLDFGAYNLYNCYKLTGDKTYWELFINLIDYVKKNQIKDRKSFGEHWNDINEQWLYLTPESSFTKAQSIPKDEDPGVYPGSMSVYAYLCLLAYNESGDEIYKNDAFSYIDYINTFLDKPQQFWTLCRTPKPNGFAFAALANIKRFELTKDKKYLDYAEEWIYLLLTMYHLRSEGGNEIGCAHAGGFGVFDYVCVASLETIEPLYLAVNLLKHKDVPALMKYVALADRRHLIAYPASHSDKKFTYKYIPMELIPQRDSFAMYMAGAIMIENTMLHALHETSDPRITAICLDAAESDLNVNKSRNMILYNPTSDKIDFKLCIKHLDNGYYRIRAKDMDVESVSSYDLLMNGLSFHLEANKHIRISIDKK